VAVAPRCERLLVISCTPGARPLCGLVYEGSSRKPPKARQDRDEFPRRPGDRTLAHRPVPRCTAPGSGPSPGAVGRWDFMPCSSSRSLLHNARVAVRGLGSGRLAGRQPSSSPGATDGLIILWRRCASRIPSQTDWPRSTTRILIRHRNGFGQRRAGASCLPNISAARDLIVASASRWTAESLRCVAIAHLTRSDSIPRSFAPRRRRPAPWCGP
jgi:hypothetical protein